LYLPTAFVDERNNKEIIKKETIFYIRFCLQTSFVQIEAIANKYCIKEEY